MDLAALIGLLIVLGMTFAIGLLVGPLVLRVSISIYNTMVSESSAVRLPEYGRAMWIVFINMIANVIASILMGFIAGFLINAFGGSQQGLRVPVQLICVAVGFALQAAILSEMLPTSFRRAVLVILCQLLLMTTIAIAMTAVYFAATAFSS